MYRNFFKISVFFLTTLEAFGTRLSFKKGSKIDPKDVPWTSKTQSSDLKTFPLQKLLNGFQGRRDYKWNDLHLLIKPGEDNQSVKGEDFSQISLKNKGNTASHS